MQCDRSPIAQQATLPLRESLAEPLPLRGRSTCFQASRHPP